MNWASFAKSNLNITWSQNNCNEWSTINWGLQCFWKMHGRS